MARKIIIEPPRGLDGSALAIRRRLMELNTPDRRPALWMTREQAAEQLKISARSVDRHRANGELGYFRGPVSGFTAAVRFWSEDVFRLERMHNNDL